MALIFHRFSDIHVGTELVAFYDTDHSTIRCVNCDFLVHLPTNSVANVLMQCSKCINYEKTLLQMLRRSESSKDSDRCDPQNHANYQHLTTPEKHKRMQELHQQNRIRHHQIDHLKAQLEKAT